MLLVRAFIFIPAFILIASFAVSTEAYPGAAIHILEAAQRAQSPAMVDPAVYRYDADPNNCSNSGENAAAIAMSQLRVDASYINDYQCNIRPATNGESAQLASVGTFTSTYHFASAEVIANSDLGLSSGQVIVTNIHAFEGKNRDLPALGPNGALKKGQFTFKAAGCDESIGAARICPCSTGILYRTKRTNDYAFVVLDKPVCAAAKKKALQFKEFPADSLQNMMRANSLTVAAMYNPNEVCQSKGQGSNRRYYQVPKSDGSDADRKLYVASAAVNGIDQDPASSLFAHNGDLLKSASGGAVVSDINSANPTMVGLTVLGGDDDNRRNWAIRINSDMIEDLQACLQNKATF
jgi:hypothetical protein